MLVAALAGAACGGGSSDNIEYVLPTELPTGWVLKIATERPDQIVDVDKPDGETASDYSVSWAPASLVGSDRADASDLPDEGPLLFINVSSPFYLKGADGSFPDKPDDGVVERHGDTVSLEFTKNGSAVKVSGRQLSLTTVRKVARSLKTHGQAEWRRRLGDRLLVDRNNS